MTGIVAQNVGRTSGLIKSAGGGGVWTLIKTLTSGGSDDDLSFVDGADDVVLDSTYPIYKFTWNNIHPQTDDVDFKFQGNASGGSGYNETITSTWFEAYHDEADSGTSFAYNTSRDQANGTAFQFLHNKLGNDNDQSCAGTLHLFNPSSTTFVKHFISACTRYSENNFQAQQYIAGYFNTTSAIDEIQFKMSSGEIQGGKIKLYGLSDS